MTHIQSTSIAAISGSTCTQNTHPDNANVISIGSTGSNVIPTGSTGSYVVPTGSTGTKVVPKGRSTSIMFYEFLTNQNNELVSMINRTNEQLIKLLIIQSSSHPSPAQFESANGVRLSINNSPWRTHFTMLCFVCKYFGHGHHECPNIQERFLGTCLKCYIPGHVTDECQSNRRKPSMKIGFKEPSFFLQ